MQEKLPKEKVKEIVFAFSDYNLITKKDSWVAKTILTIAIWLHLKCWDTDTPLSFIKLGAPA